MKVKTLLVSFFVAVLVAILQQPTEIGAVTDLGIMLPTKAAEKWYVCQGYNSKYSHNKYGGDKFGLDMIPDATAAGPDGCIGGHNAAANRRVYTPADGWISWKNDKLGLVCISIRSGNTSMNKSIKVGHLKTNPATAQYPAEWRSVPKNGRVHKGYVLGYVAAANAGNAYVPHLHVSVYKGTGCDYPSGVYTPSNALPFATAYGTALHGAKTWNLYNSGTQNQWSYYRSKIAFYR